MGLTITLASLPWSEKLNGFLVGLWLATLTIYGIFNKNILKDYRDNWVLSIVFGVALLWLLNTTDMNLGLKYLERIILVALLPTVIAPLKLKHNVVFISFLCSCLTKYLIFLYVNLEWELMHIYDYWIEILNQFNQRFKETAMHPTYFSIYLVFCVQICLFYTINLRNYWRYFALVMVVLFSVFTISLGAKMPIFALLISVLIGIVVFLWKMWSHKKRMIFISSCFLLSLLTTILLLKIPNPISQDVKNYFNILQSRKVIKIEGNSDYGIAGPNDVWSKSNRIYIWSAAIELISDNFWFGVGTGDMNRVFNKQLVQNGQRYLANHNANSHNQLLDYLIRFGCLGTLLIIIGFLAYLKKSLKIGNPLYFMFLLLCMLCMLTENILSRQMGIVFFFTLNSVFYSNSFSFNIKN
jgi:O-antigen ligase